VIVILALFLDLFVFQRKAHVIPTKEALKLVAFWVGLAFAFDLLVYFTMGWDKAVLFTTAYLIEYSLSVDNLFVFLAIFTYFAGAAGSAAESAAVGYSGAIVSGDFHLCRDRTDQQIPFSGLHSGGFPDLHEHQAGDPERKGDRAGKEPRCQICAVKS